MIRKSLTLGSLLAVCATMAADDKIVVNVNGADAPHTVALTDISRITFGDGTMTIAKSSGDLTLALTDIKNMAFDLSTSSADEITAPLTDDINLTVNGRHLSATSASGKRVEIAVYDTTGAAVAHIGADATATVDFSARRPGVYIVVCGGKVVKYLNQ